MNKRKGILFENWLTRHSRICFTLSFLHTRIYIPYNFFYKKVHRDSAPHGSQQPAKYLSKMTSILKEKVFIIIVIIAIVVIIINMVPI